MKEERIRVNLTLSKEMNDLLGDLSELTGRPKAVIVREFLHNMQPAMEMTRDGLRALKDNKSVAPALQSMIDHAERGMQEMSDFNKEINQ